MTDERSWIPPRHGRPNARPWRGRLPVYPRLARHGQAGPAVRDIRRRDIRRNCQRNFRPRDIRRDAPLWRLQQRMPPDALAWRAPLPVCRPLDRRGPVEPGDRDNVRLVPRMSDKAHTRARPAPTMKGTIR